MTGSKLMPDLYLKQLGYTYSTCELFTKRRERIRKFREIGNLTHLYKNKLDKVSLLMIQHILIVNLLQKELFQISF